MAGNGAPIVLPTMGRGRDSAGLLNGARSFSSGIHAGSPSVTAEIAAALRGIPSTTFATAGTVADASPWLSATPSELVADPLVVPVTTVSGAVVVGPPSPADSSPPPEHAVANNASATTDIAMYPEPRRPVMTSNSSHGHHHDDTPNQTYGTPPEFPPSRFCES